MGIPGKKKKGVVVVVCMWCWCWRAAASSSERAATEYACKAIAIERIVAWIADDDDGVPDRCCGRV